MTNNYDLEGRVTKFGVGVAVFCRTLKLDSVNCRIVEQVIGSCGSVGANYLEANDALGKKDFVMRLKIARKEAKEAVHWLEMLKSANPNHSGEIEKLVCEAVELQNILSAIISKV
ncbi:MAG: four helix bundle protein [Candidatus Berkelbacteria bacterium]